MLSSSILLHQSPEDDAMNVSVTVSVSVSGTGTSTSFDAISRSFCFLLAYNLKMSTATKTATNSQSDGSEYYSPKSKSLEIVEISRLLVELLTRVELVTSSLPKRANGVADCVHLLRAVICKR